MQARPGNDKRRAGGARDGFPLHLKPFTLHRSGITLVELLIAMTILVVLTGSTMVIFRGITGAWRTGQMRTERYQQARLLFDLFNRELATNVMDLRYPFIGLDADGPEQINSASTADEVYFVGTLPGRAGLVERGYWVDDAQHLMCHDDEPADGDYASGVSELCGTKIEKFDVTYFDGSQWLSAWDGRPAGLQAALLPKAVHIVLVVGGEAPRRFETVIYIPTS